MIKLYFSIYLFFSLKVIGTTENEKLVQSKKEDDRNFVLAYANTNNKETKENSITNIEEFRSKLDPFDVIKIKI